MEHATYVLTAPNWVVPIGFALALLIGFLLGRFSNTDPEVEGKRLIYTVNLPIWATGLIISVFVIIGFVWGAHGQ